MRKAALIVMAVAVAAVFSASAFAGESTPCSTCAKPCAKPCVTPCAKPCAAPSTTCATPCAQLPKVKMNWAWPTMCVECPTPCPKPCAPAAMTYTRNVLGSKVPGKTYRAGNANSDKATSYEAALVSGQ